MKVPFSPGRTDATQEMTDVESFAVLEPTADGFRNYLRNGDLIDSLGRGTADRSGATCSTLTAPEMTVLVGGLRVLNANVGQSPLGVFTKRPGSLTNDFFVNLLDMSTEWRKSAAVRARLRGSRPPDGQGQVDRHGRRSALRLELATASHRRSLRLRRLRRRSSSATSSAAWNKVMNLDRFDLAAR